MKKFICKKCGRTSELVLLDKNCPFCEPKYYPIKIPTDIYGNTIPQSTTKIDRKKRKWNNYKSK